MKYLITLILLTGGFNFFSSDICQLIISEKNTSFLGVKSLIHKSENCRVESYNLENSKFVDGKIYVLTIFKNKMVYKVTNKNFKSNNFYVNSNFFTPSVKPIGEVRIEGHSVSRRVHGGGYFSTGEGTTNVTPYSRPNKKFISQSPYLSVINGKPVEKYSNTTWGKLKTYRVLIGENYDGDIIVIHSNNSAMVSIRQINQIAIQSSIKNAIHLDGGSSVEIKLEDGSYSHSFSALSSFGKFVSNINNPPIHIVGNFIN